MFVINSQRNSSFSSFYAESTNFLSGNRKGFQTRRRLISRVVELTRFFLFVSLPFVSFGNRLFGSEKHLPLGLLVFLIPIQGQNLWLPHRYWSRCLLTPFPLLPNAFYWFENYWSGKGVLSAYDKCLLLVGSEPRRVEMMENFRGVARRRGRGIWKASSPDRKPFLFPSLQLDISLKI